MFDNAFGINIHKQDQRQGDSNYRQALESAPGHHAQGGCCQKHIYSSFVVSTCMGSALRTLAANMLLGTRVTARTTPAAASGA